jgi:hypothetical protein
MYFLYDALSLHDIIVLSIIRIKHERAQEIRINFFGRCCHLMVGHR